MTLEPLNLGDDFVRNEHGAIIDVRGFGGGDHAPDCPAFVDKWREWFDRSFSPSNPPAMLDTRLPDDEYRQLIGPKSRNMLKRADTVGVKCGVIDHNAHLDAIYRINRSMPVRSGGPMRPAYLTRPALISRQLELCDVHRVEWIGAFILGELRAYAHLVIVNELAIVNTILGEGDYMPKTGLMNALIEHLRFRSTIAKIDANNVPWFSDPAPVRYLNYLTLNCAAGLAHFKSSMGFRSTPIGIA